MVVAVLIATANQKILTAAIYQKIMKHVSAKNVLIHALMQSGI